MKNPKGYIFIVSLDWKLRSYLKAELLARNLESMCLEKLEDLEKYLLGNEKMLALFIDCKDMTYHDLLNSIYNLEKITILLDPPKELIGQFTILKRPLTISDCVNEILNKIK